MINYFAGPICDDAACNTVLFVWISVALFGIAILGLILLFIGFYLLRPAIFPKSRTIIKLPHRRMLGFILTTIGTILIIFNLVNYGLMQYRAGETEQHNLKKLSDENAQVDNARHSNAMIYSVSGPEMENVAYVIGSNIKYPIIETRYEEPTTDTDLTPNKTTYAVLSFSGNLGQSLTGDIQKIIGTTLPEGYTGQCHNTNLCKQLYSDRNVSIYRLKGVVYPQNLYEIDIKGTKLLAFTYRETITSSSDTSQNETYQKQQDQLAVQHFKNLVQIDRSKTTFLKG